MNSPLIQEKLSHSDGTVARWSHSSMNDAALIDEIYLTFFSRFPEDAERQTATQYLQQHASQRQSAVEDLAWSLLNTTEFVFQH